MKRWTSMEDQPLPMPPPSPARDRAGAVLMGLATAMLLYPTSVDHTGQIAYFVEVVCPDGYRKRIAETDRFPLPEYTVDCESDTAGPSQVTELP